MNEIKQQIKEVIEHSQKIENANVDELYADWAKNKEKFRKAFGGEIYEYGKIQLELDETAKKERLNNLKSSFIEQGYRNLSTFIRIEQDGFYKNEVIEEYKMADGKIIPKGMKLVKAFKYFVNNNPSLLEEFQTQASMLIQESKIEGTLCLSIHPLDYLSSSENNYNWRSCHSLDGAYRAGNLSYMTDTSTIVCYLKGEEEVKLPHFPDSVKWNNKKWRMLLYINENGTVAFAGRQYPFATTAIFPYLQEMFNKLFTANNPIGKQWTKWQDHYYTTDYVGNAQTHFDKKYFPMKQGPVALEDFVIDNAQSLHYNDLIDSHLYKYPYYSMLAYPSYFGDSWQLLSDPSKKVYIGNDVYCLKCGEKLIKRGQNTMMCLDCELKYGAQINDTFGFCDCCGERVFLDDCTYLEYNGKSYCPSCARDYLAECVHCEELMDTEDLCEDDEGNYICSYCLDVIKESTDE